MKFSLALASIAAGGTTAFAPVSTTASTVLKAASSQFENEIGAIAPTGKFSVEVEHSDPRISSVV